MLGTIIVLVLFVITLITIVLSIIDSWTKRKRTGKPTVSFIIPAYNDAETIETTIDSIYESRQKINEVFIINDCSKDNTLEVLNSLKKKYPKIRIINNKKNKGKSASINEVYPMTTGEIVFLIDADIVLSKQAVNDCLIRLSNEKVGGVSCRYKVKNKGFLPAMQEIEYNFLGLLQSAYNPFSTISMWGGCMAFKRKAFEDIGLLSINAICEDMDAALKLQEHGWKCEQSNEYILTSVPRTLADWYKQKKRWASGFMQNFIKHIKIYIKNPIVVIFCLSYSFLSILYISALINKLVFFYTLRAVFYEFYIQGISIISGGWYLIVLNSSLLITKVLWALSYLLFSIPAIAYDTHYKISWKYLLIIPFSFIYYPIYIVTSLIGLYIGMKKYKKLEDGERAW